MKAAAAFLIFFLSGTSIAFPGCNKGGAASQDTEDSVNTTAENLPDTAGPAAFDIGNGVNLQPSYYNRGHVNFGWELMQQNAKIRTVRIEIEPDIAIRLAASWIVEAIGHGYTVIATYHKSRVLGSNDMQDLIDAAGWWKANYGILAEAGPFYINLMNEWGDHNLSSDRYADAYNRAIGIVREVYKGPVIIDCPGWGQETGVAADAVKRTDGKAISDTNIVLSVHVYPNGWNRLSNHSLQQSDLDTLAATGKPCMIGEFGSLPEGNADWAGLVKYAQSLGWPVLGWCWNGDGGEMNMASPAWKMNAEATAYTQSNYFSTIMQCFK